MKTPWMKALAIALLAASTGVLAPACADNESSLFIRACLVPDDSCSVEPSPETAFRSGGSMDASILGEYSCVLLLGNQLAPVGNDSLRTETSRIQVYAFDVTVTDRLGAVVGEFSSPTSGFIDPGQAPSAGYGAVGATLVDFNTVQKVAAQGEAEGRSQPVIATVIARGRTLGGTEVESAPWSFPIEICRNCGCTPNCTWPLDAEPLPSCLRGREGNCVVAESSCTTPP